MTSPTRLRLVEDTDPSGAGEARLRDAEGSLLDALASDALQARLEAACEAGAAALREEVPVFRAILKERGHRFRRHDREHEETAEALYELAGKLLPASRAAALTRIRERVVGRQEARTAQEAVEELVAAEHDWYDELVLLSGMQPGQERLRSVAQRLWNELRNQGQHHEPKGFADHVWMVVRDFFPGSPGAAWDSEWADGIYSEALRDLARHASESGVDYAIVDLGDFECAFDEMQAPEEARDRCAFRSAARRAVREGRRAVREAAEA